MAEQTTMRNYTLDLILTIREELIAAVETITTLEYGIDK